MADGGIRSTLPVPPSREAPAPTLEEIETDLDDDDPADSAPWLVALGLSD